MRKPKATRSQASKSGKLRRSINNSEAKVNTSKSNESCLANSSVLIPPRSFLESQKIIQGTSLIQSFTTTEPKTVRQIGQVEFFGLDSERSGGAENSLSANGLVCANYVGISEGTNKTLNNFGNDTRTHFNSPSSAHPHASSTPKTAKNPFNPFFPSSPPGSVGHRVKPDGDPNPKCIDMEVDNSVELVFGNDSNNFDDSRFSDNTQFLLLASERLEDVVPSNVEKNKTDGVRLPEVEGGNSRTVPPGKGSKHSENKSSLDDAAQFHEDILAGSQLMEEFMQNTFDANGKYGSGKIASTPKNRPPTASTPRDIGSAPKGKPEKKTPRVTRDDTFSDMFVNTKLYCQVIPKQGKPRDKTMDSEKKKKKQVKLDRSKKAEKSIGKAVVIDDDKVHTDPQERKQNCSLLFDARAPYSEEMFDDDDDDLVFEAPAINPEGSTKAKGLPTDGNTTSCTKQSEPKQIDPASNMNSFTKLKTFDSNAIPKNFSNIQCPPVDSVEIHGQSKALLDSNLAPASEMANNEPLFEENELFNSFFDQSGDFNVPVLENQDPKIAKSNLGADPKYDFYNNELITPTAAAQLLDSILFDEQDENDLPTPTIKPKKPETKYQTPSCQGGSNNGLCTPSSASKKFKSFDDALTSQFDPDVEFVMKVFCDENNDGDGAKLKKWNKKAPKRHNSSNNSSNTPLETKSSTLSKIPQSPFDAGNNKIKASGTSTGLRPFIATRSETSESTSTNISKSIPKTSTIAQTICHSNSNITISKNIINNINNKVNNNINIINDISNNIKESDLDDIVPPTPPGSPERSLSKAFCSGTTTPRRLLVGVVRPSPRASEKSELFNDWSESPRREVQKKKADSRKVNSSRRLDMDDCDEKGLLKFQFIYKIN